MQSLRVLHERGGYLVESLVVLGLALWRMFQASFRLHRVDDLIDGRLGHLQRHSVRTLLLAHTNISIFRCGTVAVSMRCRVDARHERCVVIRAAFHQRVCNFLVIILRLGVEIVRTRTSANLVERNEGALLI